jgi:hypothetical protein
MSRRNERLISAVVTIIVFSFFGPNHPKAFAQNTNGPALSSADLASG